MPEAESDCGHRLVVAAQAHLEMRARRIADHLDAVYLDAGRQQGRRRVPRPVRLEPGEGTRQRGRHGTEGHLPVDLEQRLQVPGPDATADALLEARRQLADAAAAERKADRLPVAPERLEYRAAVLEGLEQVHAADAAARSAPPLAVERDHDRWPVVTLDETRGHDADDARMPALGRNHDRARVARRRIGVDHVDGLVDHRL